MINIYFPASRNLIIFTVITFLFVLIVFSPLSSFAIDESEVLNMFNNQIESQPRSVVGVEHLPVITISDYDKSPTNGSIVVFASVDKGVLNETRHIFTENGSFEFVATDELGRTSIKKVSVTNIGTDSRNSVKLVPKIITPTNLPIPVTILRGRDMMIVEYRVDGGGWTPFTTPFYVEKNAIIEARVIDAGGRCFSDVLCISNIGETY